MKVIINKFKPPMIIGGIIGISQLSNLKNLRYAGDEYVSEPLMSELDKMSAINNVNIKKDEDKLNLSLEELKKRTSPDYLVTKKFLDVDSPEYTNLADGDKKALKHLVKAAYWIGVANLKIDNRHNIEFQEYLEKEVAKGNERAKLTKILFDAQKGVCSQDKKMQKIELMKGVHATLGKGIYPEDLTNEEFHSILIKMIKEGKIDEVKTILNQRSIVERNGDELIGIDYVDCFKEEFENAAKELEKAAKYSTNKDFNELLVLQAKALRTPDEMLDGYADKKWATLQDTPLEFTITRENYQDEMTDTVWDNPELSDLLKKYKISPIGKDTIGGRVGIINKKGTEDILKVKKYIPLMAENMPLKEMYEQDITPSNSHKQTMVDVDNVYSTGEIGQFRGSICLAENLPNTDKASIKYLDGGRRNVYHRQIRFNTSPDAITKQQQILDATLNPELHKYYNPNGYHLLTIGHENGHSLGPKGGKDGLGKYKSIIEENKADMVAFSMMNVLTDAGLYTPEERKQIIVSFILDTIPTAKPTINKAHRVRSVMELNFFIKEGAVSISPDGVVDINIEKVVPAARKMLEKIVTLQMEKDIKKAEEYVNEYFIWTPELEAHAQKIEEISKVLGGKLETPLADKLLKEE
ncbi:MAG: hypothetical protein MJ231_01235 [bacterium]|nr:hypothetical protein [bacterium]